MKWDVLVHLERRKHRRQRVKDSALRGLSVLFLVMVLYLGFAESVGQSPFWQQVDKGMHFALFGAFSFMFIQVAQRRVLLRMPVWPRWALLFTLLSGWCVIAESMHLWMPSRHFEWGDMLANLLGTWIFGIVAACLFPLKETFEQTVFQPSKNDGIHPMEKLRMRTRERAKRRQASQAR